MTRHGDDVAGHRFAIPGRPDEHITLSWAAVTDVGRRRQANEDSLIVQPPVFAVADGMGGHAAGDRASAAVVDRLHALAGRDDVDEAVVREALGLAAGDIDTLAADLPLGAGTTVTGAVLDLAGAEPGFVVFNVGDSRVYGFLRNELVQVTHDHSVVQELVDAGLLSAADAESHPESNVVTRALGFREVPRPDYWTVPIRVGLRLLLCSDGLTKELDADRLRLHLSARLSASETAAALVDAALAAGGRDNVTVVIVDVLDAPEPAGSGLYNEGSAGTRG
ncbi:PP2C family protein-serine/threonine phosphatase [Protaetiibacter mangrovi]|uniref:Protein phosphatase 2C domain-containing protein n=1 Tax=Protaetiibacter mangrovi TaxID=2970926 RepID=A0ABT1ZJ53_9MICO|nr:protein phosphatase 2C domain-containing protein [Protaetiibacter mangrovi]MCS0500718.1 protein phosphatase 2C domain-containing protein [Protaetiibacter mangrovi]TPW91257.1 serine/threonine-protein phosphatase [Schumannella luteola]